jgi:hypothetical protein
MELAGVTLGVSFRVSEIRRLFNGGGDGEQMVDLRGFKEIENAGSYPGCNEPDSFILAAHKVTNDKAETARIHVRHFSEIEDVD